MGVTRLLLLGPFYTIQTKRDQTFYPSVCDLNLTLPVNMSVMRLDTLKFPAFPGLSSVDGFCLGSAVVLYSPWFLPPVKLLPDNFRDLFLLNAEFSGV